MRPTGFESETFGVSENEGGQGRRAEFGRFLVGVHKKGRCIKSPRSLVGVGFAGFCGGSGRIVVGVDQIDYRHIVI